MRIHKKADQIKAVLVTEMVLVGVISFLVYSFWDNICGSSLPSCLGNDELFSLPKFFLLSIIRPFVFTPISLFYGVAGENFGTLFGGLLNACGAVLSGLIIFFIARLVGKKIVDPWLKRNLPQTHRLMRSQDYKIILLLRLIPFAHFDLSSLLFGLAAFRVKYFVIFTFIGVLPESFLIAHFVGTHTDFWARTMLILVVLTLILLIPALTYEWLGRKTTLFTQLKNTYRELLDELQDNNEIIKRTTFSPQRTPVLLLYGFFSSRNCLMVIERILSSRGYDVLSFNLGGLFGVFFTKGVTESAVFIEQKLQHLFERHDFDKVNIVAHSKGGLVALWWLLKMGGARHCHKLITLGTPFKGTKLAYIALMTPLGFVWHDIWEMRPNSAFLKTLRDSEIPPQLAVHCIHSLNDRVASGEDGIFVPREGRVTPVPMHHVRHLEFLSRRDVADMITLILGED